MYVHDICSIVWEILRLRRCKAVIINSAFRSALENLLVQLRQPGQQDFEARDPARKLAHASFTDKEAQTPNNTLGHSLRERIGPAGTLETAYSNNRRDAIENIIDADPMAAHVRELMADRAQWTGRASDLLQAGTNRSGWPRSARALAGRLRRAQTFLRTLGIEIVFGREGRFGTRTIRITAIGENQLHDTVSTVSRVSDNGHGAGLNHPRPGLEQSL
jgi:hypothetical protein